MLVCKITGGHFCFAVKYADNEPDVLECYSITGEYDYMLRICAKDIESLEEKILSIKKKKGVVKSHTIKQP